MTRRCWRSTAGGLSTREIQLEGLYGVEVSPTLISNVTDEVRAWRSWSRSLQTIYPILYFNALFVKSRQDGAVKNKAVYLALGINLEGEKELLGLWMAETEGAKFWLSVFNELKSRGVDDCFVACVDGLKGLPEAIEAAYPRTQVQLCIVHKVRGGTQVRPQERTQGRGGRSMAQRPWPTPNRRWSGFHNAGMQSTQRLARVGKLTGHD